VKQLNKEPAGVSLIDRSLTIFLLMV